VFVACALVCARGLRLGAGAPFGFDPRQVVVATVVSGSGAGEDSGPAFERVVERASRVAGVRRASLASAPPGLPAPSLPLHTSPTGSRPAPTAVRLNRVQPAFFAITGARVLRGRLLDESDTRRERRVAVVTHSTAGALWPDAESLGRLLELGPERTPYEVVGVVEDPVEVATLAEPRARPTSAPLLYTPLGRAALGESGSLALVIDAERPAAALGADLAQAMRDASLDAVVVGARTIADLDRAGRIHGEVATVFSGLLGLMSALLGGLGLYAAIAHAVARRRPEIGLRMALGASARDVRRMVLQRAVVLALCGIGLGIPGALAATRLLSAGVVDLPRLDAGATLGAAGLIVGACLLAGYVPARRATRVDPAATLRAD
jgi:hypothetical protein